MVAHDGRTDDRQLDIPAVFQLVHHQRDEGIRLNQAGVREGDRQREHEKKRGEPKERPNVCTHEKKPPENQTCKQGSSSMPGRKSKYKMCIRDRRRMMNAALQLVDISKLGLNSKIKKFSYSFICGKGYSPPFGGE